MWDTVFSGRGLLYDLDREDEGGNGLLNYFTSSETNNLVNYINNCTTCSLKDIFSEEHMENINFIKSKLNNNNLTSFGLELDGNSNAIVDNSIITLDQIRCAIDSQLKLWKDDNDNSMTKLDELLLDELSENGIVKIIDGYCQDLEWIDTWRFNIKHNSFFHTKTILHLCDINDINTFNNNSVFQNEKKLFCKFLGYDKESPCIKFKNEYLLFFVENVLEEIPIHKRLSFIFFLIKYNTEVKTKTLKLFRKVHSNIFTKRNILLFIKNFNFTEEEAILLCDGQDKEVWMTLIRRKNLHLSPATLLKYKDLIDINEYSRYNPINEEIIQYFKDSVCWRSVSDLNILSEEFISKFSHKIHWNILLSKKYLSRNFLLNYKDKVFDYYFAN